MHESCSSKNDVKQEPRTSWSRWLSWLGFQKAYNIPLYIIFAGAMLGFSLARLQYLNMNIFAKDSTPGEWYWYKTGHYRIGLLLHLATILPAGILMIFQFIPKVRHRAILFHRINGYIVILLVLIGNAGALMIVRRSFGGAVSTQAAVGVLVISTTVGLVLAYYNVKKLQIEQHRAWMLRTMFYLGTIITTRLIMIIGALILSKINSYNVIMTCGELGTIHGYGYLAKSYPNCVSDSTVLQNELQIVHASFASGLPEEIGASLRMTFGTALWLSIFLHFVGVEIYLALTPREANRLRQVSYERQLEAGYSSPGSAGLVVEKFGEAEQWRPHVKDQLAIEP